jgi:hypothetical protein
MLRLLHVTLNYGHKQSCQISVSVSRHSRTLCFIQAFAPGGGGAKPPGQAVRTPGKCEKNLFGGFAPDFIVGSGGVFRGERSGDRPAVGGRKIFRCVCVGGREERR